MENENPVHEVQVAPGACLAAMDTTGEVVSNPAVTAEPNPVIEPQNPIPGAAALNEDQIALSQALVHTETCSTVPVIQETPAESPAKNTTQSEPPKTSDDHPPVAASISVQGGEQPHPEAAIDAVPAETTQMETVTSEQTPVIEQVAKNSFKEDEEIDEISNKSPEDVATASPSAASAVQSEPSEAVAAIQMDLTEEEPQVNLPPPIDVDAEPPVIVIPDDVLDVSRTEAVLTSSLALIADYGMSDDSGSDSESSSEEEESSSSSSSSSSDSDDADAVQLVDTVSYRNTVNVLSSGEDSAGSDVELVDETPGKKRSKKIIKAKGEMDVIDLPPIEDLNISVPAEECIEFGKVMSVVDQLVLVESNPGNVALDLDTVIFLESGKRTLGRIFDVLGQVNQPIYCVRFNSAEHIQEKEIVAGMKVFYNDKRPEHTTVVVLPNLMRFKGSDASWDHDIEPPQGCMEFSDDEEERAARKAKKQSTQKPIPEDPTQHRMKRVREPMNRQTRVRNPFAGPRYPHPPPQVPQMSPGNQSQWSNNNNNNQSNPWPAPQVGYGNDYGNYSWHTYYQQQQQQQQGPPPPHQQQYPPPPYGMPPPGPFYMNPYTQQGGPPPNMPPPQQQQQQWGNYYQNGNGGPGPSHGRHYKQERH